jgi:hypothetical protein
VIRVDYTGKIIGKWLVLGILSTKASYGNKTIYQVKCVEHGSLRKAAINDIKKRYGNKCRCKDFKSTKDICSDQLYQRYQKGSKHRNKGIEFSISKEEFVPLLTQNCYYCDAMPSNTIIINKKHKMLYSGVDRLDNNKGYISGNCVSCCWGCNQAKRTRSYEEFMNLIIKIYKNRSGKIYKWKNC